MNQALIVSLNFNPGHVSHLVASYCQFQDLGYRSSLYLNPEFKDYIPDGYNFIPSVEKPPLCDVAIFLFPSLNNLSLIRKLRKSGTRILYIFHEPLAPLMNYRKAGFSWKYLAKLWVIDHISALTVKWSDAILLPSHKAEQYYRENSLYKNDNATYVPLMYTDENVSSSRPREFISYIGTVAADHSFNEFLSFAEKAITENWFPGYKFLVATKSEFDIPPALDGSPLFKVQKGRPLTDHEINNFYSSTAVVWNAYARTTQSGVLAKSFMFGTPAIVLEQNINEYMEVGKTVMSVSDNTDTRQLHSAVKNILEHFEYYSGNCREFFMNTFHYRNYNDLLREIISKITTH